MKRLFCLSLVMLATATPIWAKPPLRIDGSSDAAADATFNQMFQSLPQAKQQQLAIALIEINMEGVQSAREAANNPDLQRPSAARIRLKIGGMTADEMIAYADKTSSVKATIGGHEPGVPQNLLRSLTAGQPTHSLADTIWDYDETINGISQHRVYKLSDDHSMSQIETDLKSSGSNKWEQSGNEVRLSMNDSYAVMLGEFTSATTMKGDGGNKHGTTWTWTATKR